MAHSDSEAMWRSAEAEADFRAAVQAAKLRRGALMAAIARDLPDPARFAAALPPECCAALAAAWHPGGNREVLRVGEDDAPALARLGLVEAGGVRLTAFGMQVRAAVREQRQ